MLPKSPSVRRSASGSAARVEPAVGGHPCLLSQEGTLSAGGDVVPVMRVKSEDVVQKDAAPIRQTVFLGGKISLVHYLVPALDCLWAPPEGLPSQLGEMHPQVVSLDPVHAHLPRQPDHAGKLPVVHLHEGQLEGHPAPVAAAGRVGVPHLDEGTDVLQHPLPTGTQHHLLLGGARGPVPGHLDVGGHRNDALGPRRGAPSWEGAVGGQVQLDPVLGAQVQDLVEMPVEQRFSHGRRDDLPQRGSHRLGQHPPDQADVHPPPGPPLPPPVGLGGAEGRVIFAHDAVQVAVVGIGVEGDAPRARFPTRCTCLRASSGGFRWDHSAVPPSSSSS